MPRGQKKNGPTDSEAELCLVVSKNKDEFSQAHSFARFGRPDLWTSEAAYNAGCLERFVFLIHDAEGATADTSNPSATKAAANGRMANNPLMLISPIPNSSTIFSIPNAIQPPPAQQ